MSTGSENCLRWKRDNRASTSTSYPTVDDAFSLLHRRQLEVKAHEPVLHWPLVAAQVYPATELHRAGDGIDNFLNLRPIFERGHGIDTVA